MSAPSLAFNVAFMSISVSTPNPFCVSASRVRWTAWSKDVCTVVDIAMSMPRYLSGVAWIVADRPTPPFTPSESAMMVSGC